MILQSKKVATILVTAFIAILGFLATTPSLLAASKERVLHSFNTKDGNLPVGNVIFDAAGNLYGTTVQGGVPGTGCGGYGCGTVFQLAPKGKGGWTERVLHSFGANSTDGVRPFAGLILDAGGNLYGTTSGGGDYGAGTVFRLASKANGKWSESVLHSFNANGIDGYAPFASLIFDATGNLYGTTEVGGASGTGCGGYGCGTVFELSPSGGSKWTETVLYSFTGGSDGQAPEASLILDAAGNLYGTTVEGGDFSGTVFELTPRNNRQWTEVQLHVFNGEDGENPAASLIFDAAGNLYSTISGGGVNYCDGYGCGNVFELSPDGGGEWALTILHSFDKRDGEDAQAGLAFDAAGNLYSTTYAGGTHDWGKGCDVLCGGTVFQLAPGENGTWTETVLHSFNRVAPDGEFPLARLVFDTAGNLYGTTTAGGSYGGGTVFEITR